MSEMIDVARSSVQTWQADQMGHMNVQFYVEHAAQGLAALAVRLGLGPRFIDAERLRLIARDHHIRFLREQRPGAPFTVRAGVLDVRDYGLRVYLEMYNTQSNEIAATFVSNVELLDEDTRETKPLPAKAKTAAKSMLIEMPAHGAPRGIEMTPPRKAPTLDDAESMGLHFAWQGEVQLDQCDGQGYLLPRHFMAIVSDSSPNIHRPISERDATKGGAVLEYRFHYHAYPRAGDVLTLRTGLKSVGAKTLVWGHWLFNIETGKIVTTAESVVIMFDLASRKSIDLSEELRGRLEKMVVPGIGV